MTTPDPTPTPAPDRDHPLDLAGIGIGPFNLSLAALAHPIPGLRTASYDQNPAFHWHPGLLIEGTTLQVPFLADLVTLADPTNPWSYLNYLRTHDRLFPFYFAERFHAPRAEYDAYCRWVSQELAAANGASGTGLHFSHQVDAIRWNPEQALFEIDFTRLDTDGEAEALGRSYARNLAIGIGTTPHIPDPLRPLAEAPTVPVIHSADYLDHRERLLAADHVTVIGSGQSGAEIFLDLLKHRPAGQEHLHWLTRSPAFAPMEYSKLGLEHFTPDYERYFHALPEQTRDQLLPRQWQLHKAIDHDTIDTIHQELYQRTLTSGWPQTVLTPGVTVRTAGRVGTTHIELHLQHDEQDERSRLTTSAVILATGYRERPLERILAALDPYLRRDSSERPRIDAQHRLILDPSVTGDIYLLGAGSHTHGVGTPDLGLAAHRSATILNTLTGKNPYPLPDRTAFTTFGVKHPQPDPPTPQNQTPQPETTPLRTS
ncbi:lysine N(6)-hydroxylase/L-ornithine N(5)-oxygenase family protein [Streptomyces gobiensis]|uniref:lysine N(6)-hydroxylase/L-ornithine N(5)-oxygenase family protein n=1 Tax=Streptomyces gobiensis TaxID=2875706 RepID=UPI001E4B1C3A|nr:SidA/IucD/PvdA family monooxygenase [Streptomyces gobiensis]UGY90809.1 SidA/IucD/PvdA family monooxygenase [Streptomyces gobiensis]